VAKGSFEVVVSGGDLRQEVRISPDEVMGLTASGAERFEVFGLFARAEAPPSLPAIHYTLDLHFVISGERHGSAIASFTFFRASGRRFSLARLERFDAVHSPGLAPYVNRWLQPSPAFNRLIEDSLAKAVLPAGRERVAESAKPVPSPSRGGLWTPLGIATVLTLIVGTIGLAFRSRFTIVVRDLLSTSRSVTHRYRHSDP